MDSNTYKEGSLSVIRDAHILEDQDFQVIDNLQEELERVFRVAQVFRTRTEMEASILNDLRFPTADAKYWQAIREQNVMFTELVSMSFEYRKNQVETKKTERKLQEEKEDLEKELLCIEIEKLKFTALSMERVAKDRIREIKEWEEIKNSLIPQMKCSLNDVNEHQLVSYTAMWLNQLIAAGNEGSIPERNNLIGQLDKGLKLCKERGCIDTVYKAFPPEIITKLEQNAIGGNSNVGSLRQGSNA